MTTGTMRAAALELSSQARQRGNDRNYLILRATEDGWSLIDADGRLVLRALGTAGRRHCLEFARRRGVLVVLS